MEISSAKITHSGRVAKTKAGWAFQGFGVIRKLTNANFIARWKLSKT